MSGLDLSLCRRAISSRVYPQQAMAEDAGWQVVPLCTPIISSIHQCLLDFGHLSTVTIVQPVGTC